MWAILYNGWDSDTKSWTNGWQPISNKELCKRHNNVFSFATEEFAYKKLCDILDYELNPYHNYMNEYEQFSILRRNKLYQEAAQFISKTTNSFMVVEQ